MAIKIKNKLKEMIQANQASDAIEVIYIECEQEYRESKQAYEKERDTLEDLEEKKKDAEEAKKAARIFSKQRRQAKKNIRTYEKKIAKQQKRYNKAKTAYLDNLKKYRELRKVIKTEYRIRKQYEKFFEKMKEAEKLGIDIPREIKLKAETYKTVYDDTVFEIDDDGNVTKIEKPEPTIIKYVNSLVREHKAKEREKRIRKLLGKEDKEPAPAPAPDPEPDV